MNPKENDPDTLQLLDELDPEWVNLWHENKNKKEPTTKQLTFEAIPPKKAISKTPDFNLRKPDRHSFIQSSLTQITSSSQ